MQNPDPDLYDILQSWEWHVEVVAGLLILGAWFAWGWWHLRRDQGPLAARWRLGVFWSGLLVLALAILSPLQTLTAQLFSAHMVQHMLFSVLAPTLLLSANPVPFLAWGVPGSVWNQLRGHGRLVRSLTRRLYRLTSPGLSWMLFIVTLWGWHDPSVYDAALRYALLHPIEHLSFLGTALLFWWHVSGKSPHAQGWPHSARLVYLVATSVPVMVAGMFIAASGQPLYTHYTEIARLWGITALQGQQWGGMIMFATGGLMFVLGGLIFAAQMLQERAPEPPPPWFEWDVDEPRGA